MVISAKIYLKCHKYQIKDNDFFPTNELKEKHHINLLLILIILREDVPCINQK